MGKKDSGKVIPVGNNINIFKKLSFLSSEDELQRQSELLNTSKSILNASSLATDSQDHEAPGHKESKEPQSTADLEPSLNDQANPINALSTLRKPTATKKYHNIPICEVKCDANYDERIAADFKQPPTYIRHTKRIDDDVDLIADYFLEDEDIDWLTSLLASVANDPDYVAFFKEPTSSAFEKTINILERSSGSNREVVPLITAQKILITKMDIAPLIASKVIPPVYQYWSKKRDKLSKPMSRKYWPQTQSNDTNPHHVFRARDKERYRLRRQHRRNDVESFRKMQHLRREFDRAQLLLQYVLEREYLNEASFNIEQEIFEQRLFELSNESVSSAVDSMAIKEEPTSSNDMVNHLDATTQSSSNTNDIKSPTINGLKRRREIPYRYTIQCKELVLSSGDDPLTANDPYGYLQTYQPTSNANKNKSHSMTQIKTERTSSYPKSLQSYESLSSSMPSFKKSNLKNGIYNSNHDALSMQQDMDHDDVMMKTEPMSATASIAGSGANLAVAERPRKRKSSNISGSGSSNSRGFGRFGMDIYDSNRVHGSVVENPYNLQPSAANIVDVGQYHQDVTQLKIPDVTSSLGRLQQWATNQMTTFLQTLNTRDKVPMTSTFSNPSDYMKDLEFRYHDTSSGMAVTTPIYPTSYRSRGRIGRGGRLVIDRIPIYETPNDSNLHGQNNILKNISQAGSYPTTGSSSKNIYQPCYQTYIQTTSLPITPRYTTIAMLNGHGQSPKCHVHRNNTTNASCIDGNLFYAATAASNASMNTATGVMASAYGYASAMPLSLPIAHPASSTGEIVSSASGSASMSPMPSNPATTSNVAMNNATNAASNHLHFCLPPSFPSSYRNYPPISLLAREKEVLSGVSVSATTSSGAINLTASSNSNANATSSTAISDDFSSVEILDRNKIHHISIVTSSSSAPPATYLAQDNNSVLPGSSNNPSLSGGIASAGPTSASQGASAGSNKDSRTMKFKLVI